MVHAALALLAALAAHTAWAQSVALQGMLGNRALLVVDGNPPRAVAPGDSLGNVKVVSTGGDQAVVEIDGRRHTMRIGEAPGHIGPSGRANGDRVVLHASHGGHFMPEGRINERPVVFMLDTGASLVGIGRPEAERLGLDLRNAPQVMIGTANGAVPGWRVRLATVQVGDVVLRDVDAVVTPAAMPYVLLGNSVLSRFRMTRDGDRMVLERKF